ncbi:aarF domain-containing protein kinase 1-like [Watersipora subatra]|uniref:aarF domain-containing protein kinase 1-like n=1 Tax=Watersipora subatra TaxID=2589382 RepID=UPI00355AD2A0
MLMRIAKLTGGIVAVSACGLTTAAVTLGDDAGIMRFGRAAMTGASIVVDYKRTMSSLPTEVNDEYKLKMSQVHTRSADKLLQLCCRNGGCFIKVGQHVGSLDYLLPKEYVSTLKVLHDSAPESSKEAVLQVIREDLGEEVMSQFESFSDKPIGTASLAQVHKAVLKDGTVLAVKVQHPKVKAHSFVDMNTMEVLVQTVAWLFPSFSFLWLAAETRRNLPLELDFENEGKNAERVGEMLSYISCLKVPRIYWGFSSPRVLTMEFCEGGRADDREYMLAHDIPVEEVSNNLSHMYSEMIFKHGFVHCDPHPGNVLVKRTSKHNAEIVLLDHGLYTTLTQEFRQNYAKLWMAIIKGDEVGLREHSKAMNCEDLYGLFSCMVAGRAWSSITARRLESGEVIADEDDQIQKDAADQVVNMVQVLNKVPREMLLIFKTNDCLRGIDSSLRTRFRANAFISMTKSCTAVVFDEKMRLAETWWLRLWLKLQLTVSLLFIDMTHLCLRVLAGYKQTSS